MTVPSPELDASGVLRPLGDDGPVPCGSPTDGPLRLREEVAVSPHVDGGALGPEARGDLFQPDGVHEGDCRESLDTMQGCGDNHYMTKKLEFRVLPNTVSRRRCPACTALLRNGHAEGDFSDEELNDWLRSTGTKRWGAA